MAQSLNIEVRLGERSYTIHVVPGLLDNLKTYLEEASLRGTPTIITDTHVAPIYADGVAASIGGDVQTLLMSEGEENKNLETVRMLYDGMLDLRRDRSSYVVALGGGVVGDVAGFVAATYLRGVSFVQVPTSLLAQVDSSVGGKVGVDLPQGKNLVGAFYQPKSVCIDPFVLHTLERRHLINGMAEVIKYGVIKDEGFFRFLEKNLDRILALDAEPLVEVIGRSCRIKADIVEQDEKESGIRAILNYGHTVGHAIETCMDYRGWLHGEAIAVGMLAETRIAQKLGMTDNQTFERQQTLMERTGLPTRMPRVDETQFHEAMLHDKKVLSSKIRMVLPVSLGQVEMCDDVPWKLVAEVMEEITE